MIEEQLINYGVLGVWTISLLVERWKHNKDMVRVVQNNTTAITKVYEVMQKCKKK